MLNGIWPSRSVCLGLQSVRPDQEVLVGLDLAWRQFAEHAQCGDVLYMYVTWVAQNSKIWTDLRAELAASDLSRSQIWAGFSEKTQRSPRTTSRDGQGSCARRYSIFLRKHGPFQSSDQICAGWPGCADLIRSSRWPVFFWGFRVISDSRKSAKIWAFDGKVPHFLAVRGYLNRTRLVRAGSAERALLCPFLGKIRDFAPKSVDFDRF